MKIGRIIKRRQSKKDKKTIKRMMEDNTMKKNLQKVVCDFNETSKAINETLRIVRGFSKFNDNEEVEKIVDTYKNIASCTHDYEPSIEIMETLEDSVATFEIKNERDAIFLEMEYNSLRDMDALSKFKESMTIETLKLLVSNRQMDNLSNLEELNKQFMNLQDTLEDEHTVKA